MLGGAWLSSLPTPSTYVASVSSAFEGLWKLLKYCKTHFLMSMWGEKIECVIRGDSEFQMLSIRISDRKLKDFRYIFEYIKAIWLQNHHLFGKYIECSSYLLNIYFRVWKYCTEICYWSNKIRNTEEMEGSRKDILCISLIYVRISARPPCICMISIICSPQMCLLVSAHNKIIYCIIKNKKRDGNTNARNHFCWGIYVSLLMFLFNLHLPAAP